MTDRSPGLFQSLIARIRQLFTGKPETDAPGPTTPSQVTEQAADSPIGVPGRNDEDRLDEALKETMPSSDPISVRIE
ncbi:MAG: hypothetical protein ACYC2K_16700 [Gemmatimonadales bacterium]